MSDIQYSVVIPVYQAEKTLPILIPEIIRVMQRSEKKFEIILTDDGSTDDSWKAMQLLAHNDTRIKTYRLAYNHGQLYATTCGLQKAQGSVAITTDDDFQFSPDDITELLQYYHTHGYKLVFGIPDRKIHSTMHGLNRGIASVMFRYIFLPRYKHLDYFSSLRVIDMSVINSGAMQNIYMIWKLKPTDIGNFRVKHLPTLKDRTSYTLIKRVRHFRPYILMAVRKTIKSLLVIQAVLLFLSFNYPFFNYLLLIMICSVSAFFYVQFQLKKLDSIQYTLSTSS